MSSPGTPEQPVRVAVVGAGPAGFFAAEALLRCLAPVFAVDLFERLPTPFGLVRSGVAPDHQKIKGVTKTFERTAENHRFRFFGNVEIGKDLSTQELSASYHQVVYAIGSSSDRRLGIPGEELDGSYSATAFVGWYNAHPDFRDFPFDLRSERAVVVGVGNVAMDVARVLLKSPEQLAKTDIARHALEALRASRLREIVLLARRGPAEAAFDPRELQDVAEMADVSVSVDLAAVEADLAGHDELDARQKRNLELMLECARSTPSEGARTLRLEFNASPVELLADASRHIRAVRAERTASVAQPNGRRTAKGTGHFFEIDTGIVFRSIGYRGEPLPGLPFDEGGGVIPNVDGRITGGPDADVLPGLYAVGWIRRGPYGVIGTNKADAHLVVSRMLEDVPALPERELPPGDRLEALLEQRGVRATSYQDWRIIDTAELEQGKATGKIREKVASVEQMMNELLKTARPQE